MSKNTAGALALVLLWLSFAAFFVAFHPGGIKLNGKPAKNPRDVILWFMQRIATGGSGTQAQADQTQGQGTQTV